MARIESAGEARTISIETARPRRSWRVGDLVGVAAALLLGTSVLWPMVTAARMDSVKTACLSNMRTVGGGMGMYANEYRDSMPIATAGLGGGRWWDVGSQTGSNSRNLFTLARKGFVKVEDLACPGNPGCKECCVTPQCEDWRSLDEVSYSYQIMLGGHHPAWSRPGGNPSQTIVMADRSPVVLKNARGEAVSTTDTGRPRVAQPTAQPRPAGSGTHRGPGPADRPAGSVPPGTVGDPGQHRQPGLDQWSAAGHRDQHAGGAGLAAAGARAGAAPVAGG